RRPMAGSGFGPLGGDRRGGGRAAAAAPPGGGPPAGRPGPSVLLDPVGGGRPVARGLRSQPRDGGWGLGRAGRGPREPDPTPGAGGGDRPTGGLPPAHLLDSPPRRFRATGARRLGGHAEVHGRTGGPDRMRTVVVWCPDWPVRTSGMNG